MGYEKILQKLTFYKAFFSPQWKFLIHTILQCLSSKTTRWNEFSSTMASAIICLAINLKFNFSKYIFESMVKNVDSVGKFLMYPRFVQVFLNQQLEGMATHDRIYVTPSHTKKKQTPRKPLRKNTEVLQPSGSIDNVADEAVNEEMHESLGRAATTATSLEAKQDSGKINKTQFKATPNEPSSLGTRSGGSPRPQETMGDTIAQTRSENVSKHSNDLLLAGVNTPRSGEDRLKLEKLMELCTTLQSRVLALETTKTTQAMEITSLKRRVRKLERRNKSRTHKLKRLYKGRISDIDASKDIYRVNVHRDEDMFGVNDLDGDEVVVETEVAAAKDVNLSLDEVTLAQELWFRIFTKGKK
ncbi:hypothetical protein Tco_0983501 [Tanacetum coccineum]